ncbi:hypothetical protein BDZ97DRAFT_1752087 [Flammula alnicola]|nr:hypothetical protein BDZ97DRAFT_1752087 [Flammula alnicola]
MISHTNALGLEPEGINLDLSSRNKIVIRTKRKETAHPKGVTQGPSVFSHKVKTARPASELASDATVEDPEPPKVVQRPVVEPLRSIAPSKRPTITEIGRVKRDARVVQAAIVTEKKSKKPVKIPPPKLTLPKEGDLSQYAEEYAKCGCARKGLLRCQRCKLFRLAERFCNLIDLQREKWKAEI